VRVGPRLESMFCSRSTASNVAGSTPRAAGNSGTIQGALTAIADQRRMSHTEPFPGEPAGTRNYQKRVKTYMRRRTSPMDRTVGRRLHRLAVHLSSR